MKEKLALRDKSWSPESRRKLAITQLKGVSTIVVNTVTKEDQSFISGLFFFFNLRITDFTASRKIVDSVIKKKKLDAAKFIGLNQSTIAKYISKNHFYLGGGFLVYKSSIALDEIFSSVAYKEAIYKLENKGGKKYTHSESAKEAIRKANSGKKLSVELKQKLSLDSKNAKAVISTNNETKERLEFPSIVSASKSLGISKSYLESCLKNNKPCKGYTIAYK